MGTEVPSGVQRQNIETIENTNGSLTKIDLQWRGTCTHAPPPLAMPMALSWSHL